MAFLDSSGTILVDAVLTDTGRARLARGDGSFKIVKFAVADDEIDYSLYDPQHESTSQRDADILNTPIFEAFTNNASSMNSKLVTIPRNNIQYLPTLKVNDKFDAGRTAMYTSGIHRGEQATLTVLPDGKRAYVVAVDAETEAALQNTTGVLNGVTTSLGGNIQVDQGLDTNYRLGAAVTIPSDLTETQYIIEMDNNFGSVVSVKGTPAAPSYIDDDNMATYYFSLGADNDYVSENTDISQSIGDAPTNQVIKGPRGTTIVFKIRSSTELSSNPRYFTDTAYMGFAVAGEEVSKFHYVVSTIRVSGVTCTGTIEIPVVFLKKE